MDHFYQNIKTNEFSHKSLYDLFVKECSNESIIVEVGSWLGKSISYLGVELLNNNKTPEIFCIDTWRPSLEYIDYFKEDLTTIVPIESFSDSSIKPSTPVPSKFNEGFDPMYNMFLQNIQPIRNLISILRTDSFQGAQSFEDGTVSFLCLDANFLYEEVKRDIESWFPKIKPGGILAIHTFFPNSDGIYQAVRESDKMNGFVDNQLEYYIYKRNL